MKRIGDIFDRIISMENLDEASKRACRTRKNKTEVERFLENKNENLMRLHETLKDGTYRSSEYRTFDKMEHGKLRHIADIPLYPDRILHWAICLITEPLFIPKLIDQTYASIPGKGYHDAVHKVYGYLRSDPRLKYALTLDIHKFFQSIDKDILKQKLEHTFKDKRFLLLMKNLIDDWIESGIPIGNRYSPFLANLYMSEIMHSMKEEHHVHYLVMFMDDLCILGYSKEWLRRMLRIFREKIKDIRLELKPNYQIFPIESRGIAFLGYRIYPTHILLLKRTKKKLIRASERMKAHQNQPSYRLSQYEKGVLASYNGVLKCCNGYGLKQRYIAPILKEESQRT